MLLNQTLLSLATDRDAYQNILFWVQILKKQYLVTGSIPLFIGVSMCAFLCYICFFAYAIFLLEVSYNKSHKIFPENYKLEYVPHSLGWSTCWPFKRILSRRINWNFKFHPVMIGNLRVHTSLSWCLVGIKERTNEERKGLGNGRRELCFLF